MPKAVFEEVGGFNERDLAVSFNDVDLCLRIREAGYRIVWTPYAELYHLESASRGSDHDPDKSARFKSEIDYMFIRCAGPLARHPNFNPNLSLATASILYAFPS